MDSFCLACISGVSKLTKTTPGANLKYIMKNKFPYDWIWGLLRPTNNIFLQPRIPFRNFTLKD